jgi:hypothetical protein
MSYAFVQDVPANEAVYRQIRDRLGDETPQGLVAHVVIKRDAGLRYVDVWDTRADWERYRDEHVDPAVREVLAGLGIPHDPSQVDHQQVEVIEAWLGSTSVPARA